MMNPVIFVIFPLTAPRGFLFQWNVSRTIRWMGMTFIFQIRLTTLMMPWIYLLHHNSIFNLSSLFMTTKMDMRAPEEWSQSISIPLGGRLQHRSLLQTYQLAHGLKTKVMANTMKYVIVTAFHPQDTGVLGAQKRLQSGKIWQRHLAVVMPLPLRKLFVFFCFFWGTMMLWPRHRHVTRGTQHAARGNNNNGG